MDNTLQRTEAPADAVLELRASSELERIAAGLRTGDSAIDTAIAVWAGATTSETPRRRDLLRDKAAAAAAFFRWSGKAPQTATSADVAQWAEGLREAGLAAATVYYRVSRLSSFYTWLITRTPAGMIIRENPVRAARPAAPRKYQTESVKALDSSQVRKLVTLVRELAETDPTPIGKRDYALLLFYLGTGMRRSEVIGLRGCDIEAVDGRLIVQSLVKGGDYVAREIRAPQLQAALVDYLEYSGRRSVLGTRAPLWTRHDRSGSERGGQLSGRAFANNLKRYAALAGLGDVHLHQMRHTFARMVVEQSGSLQEAQEALGHRDLETTRVYVQRVGLRRDRFGERVAQELFE